MITLFTLSAITAAIVQAIKVQEIFPRKFLPFMSILMGVIVTVPAGGLVDLDVIESVYVGIMNGLSAVGLYEGIKKGPEVKDILLKTMSK